MKEKLELWEMSLPVEDLERLKEYTKRMSAESGIKMTASDVFRHVLKVIYENPQLVAKILAKRINEVAHGKPND